MRSPSDLIALVGPWRHEPPVAQLGDELTVEYQDDVAALAPVIGHVACRLLHDAHTHVAPW
jgi:hypothetical protein